jgi:hypothetical protein
MSRSELDLGPTTDLNINQTSIQPATLTIQPYFPPFQNQLMYPKLAAELDELYDTS